MNLVLAFLKKFIIKYATTYAVEKVLILILEEAVNRSDSEINKKIYDAVFSKIKKGEE